MMTHIFSKLISPPWLVIIVALFPMMGCNLSDTPPVQDNRLPDRYLSETQRAEMVRTAHLPGKTILMNDDQSAITWPASILVEDFETLAFGPIQRESDNSKLQKWVDPVRISINFDQSLSAEERLADLSQVLALTSRLEHYTGHPIRLTETSPNVQIWVMDRARIMALGENSQQLIREQISSNCTLQMTPYQSPEKGLSEATIYVVTEPNKESRQHCYRQLIAQSLGLTGGMGQLPSILSADPKTTEFTSHDDLMLRILYDPRLQAGITRDEARPIVQMLANELDAS